MALAETGGPVSRPSITGCACCAESSRESAPSGTLRSVSTSMAWAIVTSRARPETGGFVSDPSTTGCGRQIESSRDNSSLSASLETDPPVSMPAPPGVLPFNIDSNGLPSTISSRGFQPSVTGAGNCGSPVGILKRSEKPVIVESPANSSMLIGSSLCLSRFSERELFGI